MIQVFCGKRGIGKTKAMIGMANERAVNNKGNIVYIDDDDRPMYNLDRKIRFISTEDYGIRSYEGFYGFLCGILSEDYDIDTIYIDGLLNIVPGELMNAALLFYNLEKISDKYSVDFYISVNGDEEIPEFVKKYVA